MNGTDMIIFNELAAGNVCFSLPGALSVIPVRFSFPAPELNFTSWFTVSTGIHSEWLFIQENLPGGNLFQYPENQCTAGQKPETLLCRPQAMIQINQLNISE